MLDKFVFQNAKIKHRESKLLPYQTVQRLLDCTKTEDAFKILTEAGFGAGVSVENGDFDAMFAAEEANAVAILKEMNVDGALDAFLIQYDYLNLKALLKASVTGAKVYDAPCGKYEIEDLQTSIVAGDTSKLSVYMADAVKSVQKLIADEKANPRAIDTLTDRAMYKEISVLVKKSGKLAEEYFIRKIDYTNILTFMRCRKLGLDQKAFADNFIEGGELDIKTFEAVFEATDEAFKDKCKFTAYQDIVAKLADEANFVAFEVETDNALLNMWKANKSDMFSIAPIVSYYLTKITEIKVTKLIVAGIKNHVDAALIRERMRDLYA